MDAVIGDAGLFTENGYRELLRGCFVDQFFDKAVANHAVANNNDTVLAHACLKICGICAYLSALFLALIDVHQLRLYIPI